MNVIYTGYKEHINMNESKRMLDSYKKCTYKCRCGHSVAIPFDRDKRICSYCGKYVFKNKKDEFHYRLKEVIK